MTNENQTRKPFDESAFPMYYNGYQGETLKALAEKLPKTEPVDIEMIRHLLSCNPYRSM
jgi:hypothetical protein